MGDPHSHLVDPDAPGYFHGASRCVRRAFLCGVVEDTGKDVDHRRSWREHYIDHLAKQYAIAVLAHAVMTNHVHLVIATDPGTSARWVSGGRREESFPALCSHTVGGVLPVLPA